MFSAGAKAGLVEGDILVQINGWKIEAMDTHQAALNVFLAAGYNVAVGWIKSENNNHFHLWDQLDFLLIWIQFQTKGAFFIFDIKVLLKVSSDIEWLFE